MTDATPCGPALQALYHRRNVRVGDCRVPHAVPLRTKFGNSARQFAALELPNGWIVADERPLTAHTALDMSLAHGLASQSSRVVGLFGAEAAVRVFKTPTAFVQACYYELRMRKHVAAVIAGDSSLTETDDAERLLRELVAHFRQPADLDQLLGSGARRHFVHVKGKPRDQKALLERIGGCGERSGRDNVSYELRATGDVADDANKAEIVGTTGFQARLKAALTSDGVEAPQAHKRQLKMPARAPKKPAAAPRKRKKSAAAVSASSSESSSESSESAEAVEALPADGDADTDDAEWRPTTAPRAKRRKPVAAATAPSMPSSAVGAAIAALSQRIVASDASPRDPIEAGRVDGARDVVGYVQTQFATPPMPPPLPTKFGKADLSAFLAQDWREEVKPAHERRVPITVPVELRETLAALLANPIGGTATQRALLAVQAPLRQYCASGWTDAAHSVLVLRREHVASERHWRECSDAFVAGVQHAFVALLTTGTAPALETPPDAESGLLCVTETFELADGRRFDERGVLAGNDYAAGQRVGVYRCAPVPGADDELDGEAALLRAAGVAEVAAEDAFAVRVEDGRVFSARRTPSTSLLALMNHSATPNVQLDGEYDAAAGGVWAVATRPIAAGELLHIDYGVGYIERMRALGVELGRSVGVRSALAQPEAGAFESQLDALFANDMAEFNGLFVQQELAPSPAPAPELAFSPHKSGVPRAPLFGGALDLQLSGDVDDDDQFFAQFFK